MQSAKDINTEAEYLLKCPPAKGSIVGTVSAGQQTGYIDLVSAGEDG